MLTALDRLLAPSPGLCPNLRPLTLVVGAWYTVGDHAAPLRLQSRRSFDLVMLDASGARHDVPFYRLLAYAMPPR